MKGSIWLALMATCMVLKHTHSICKYSLCFNHLWHDKCSQTKCRLCKKYQAMYFVVYRAFSGWQRRICIYHDANILDFYNHKTARAFANLTLLPCQTFEYIVIHFLCISKQLHNWRGNIYWFHQLPYHTDNFLNHFEDIGWGFR